MHVQRSDPTDRKGHEEGLPSKYREGKTQPRARVQCEQRAFPTHRRTSRREMNRSTSADAAPDLADLARFSQKFSCVHEIPFKHFCWTCSPSPPHILLLRQRSANHRRLHTAQPIHHYRTLYYSQRNPCTHHYLPVCARRTRLVRYVGAVGHARDLVDIYLQHLVHFCK